MGDARAEARIALEEPFHAIAIAGEDDHEILALRFHHLQQDLDRLLSVVALVLGPVEIVSLVDEQHAAHRLLQDLLGLRRGVADILPDQIVARDADDMAAPHEAEPMQDVGHPQRDRGLAGAGIAGERHVQRRKRGRERHLLPDALDQQQRGDLANPRLHRARGRSSSLSSCASTERDVDRVKFAAKVDGSRRGVPRRVHAPSACRLG